VFISRVLGNGEQKPLGALSSIFAGRCPRLNHVFKIWWRSVQGFSVGWGSNFAISHWLRRSSLQRSYTPLSNLF